MRFVLSLLLVLCLGSQCSAELTPELQAQILQTEWSIQMQEACVGATWSNFEWAAAEAANAQQVWEAAVVENSYEASYLLERFQQAHDFEMMAMQNWVTEQYNLHNLETLLLELLQEANG